jgi:hypothetical protein
MSDTSNDDDTTKDEEVAAETPPPAPAPATAMFAYGEGDLIFIHSNAGKYIAEVDKAYASYADAEEDFELSFQTITKKGPLYDYNAPHYLCHLANPGATQVGACELDTTLKARCED